MKGRIPPMPPIIYALPRADDPSQAIDAAFFQRYPDRRSYTRRYIAGEDSNKSWPPGTLVHVLLIDGERVRGFAPPATYGGLN